MPRQRTRGRGCGMGICLYVHMGPGEFVTGQGHLGWELGGPDKRPRERQGGGEVTANQLHPKCTH